MADIVTLSLVEGLNCVEDRPCSLFAGFDSVAGGPFGYEQLKICRECLVLELGR